ncbi:MAG: xanthine dehydrogenase family protein subunit M [Deltaproteobacteria bacterium CG_4_8_14_3_um_filter_45_9]|nr:MAG: xanthine dehydrogenase family protein subunit M [Deltaproteobacteria bacterium CG_4_8_14_3_um_filter_45_9]
MIPPFDYKTPNTIEEAIELLWQAGGKAKIIAGGTDLVIGLRNGDLSPQFIVDITRIEDLRKIEEKNGMVSIGAAITHSEIASSSLVKKYGKVLSDAASEIGSPQIRNMGTIGGNIINASPAADTIPPLMVLNAMGRVVSKEGEREVPLGQLFKGPYKTNLKPHDLLVQITFQKLPPETKSSFVRLARRNAMAIARMNVAIILQIGKNRIEDVRIAVGSVTPTPQRMSEAETFLKGKLPDQRSLQKASLKVSEAMIKRSGIRASTAYKRPVVEALFMRAMRKALEG